MHELKHSLFVNEYSTLSAQCVSVHLVRRKSEVAIKPLSRQPGECIFTRFVYGMVLLMLRNCRLRNLLTTYSKIYFIFLAVLVLLLCLIKKDNFFCVSVYVYNQQDFYSWVIQLRMASRYKLGHGSLVYTGASLVF